MKYFKLHMAPSHPTCEAEIQILGINESNLRHQIFSKFSMEEIGQYRPMIEKKILEFVQMKLNDIIDDEQMMGKIMGDIKSSDFDCLFHFHS